VTRVDLLALLALAAPWLAAWALPVFAQPQSFHDYADQRMWLGVPHAADVLTNLPFLLIGALGLRLTSQVIVADRRAACAYALLFLGVLLTAFGSAWYHLNPNDGTLVWDRLPMALGFAGLVAATLADRAPQRAIPFALALASGAAATVIYWHATANLLPYLVMQACSMAVVLVTTAWIASGYSLAGRVYWAAGIYALALICERLDHLVYASSNGIVSGHSLKHLAAAAAIAVIYTMLRNRKPVPA
jgi:hypothetical protein